MSTLRARLSLFKPHGKNAVQISNSSPKGVKRKLIIAGLLVATVAGGSVMADVTAASAAPGDAFDPSVPRVFVAQDERPTTLYIAEQGSTVKFVEQGGTCDPLDTMRCFAYNAIGFNSNDNFLYGIRQNNGSQTDNLNNHLVSIGEGGVVTDLGEVSGLPLPSDSYNQGTFGQGSESNILYVRQASRNDTIYAVDVTTKSAEVIKLSQGIPNVSDLVYSDGFLWSFTASSAFRINPTTGEVLVVQHGLNIGKPLTSGSTSSPFGAQWVYGNGNFGVSHNNTGEVYQIAVTDPGSDAPTFTKVSTSKGPSSSNNDGASTLGLDVDLAIVKTGPANYKIGDVVSFTLTVTNNGPGNSSGFVVTDQVPDSLTNVVSETTGCMVTGNLLECTFGALPVGQSQTIMVSGVVSEGTTGAIVNTAKVLGNEADPVQENDESTFTTVDTPVVPPVVVDPKTPAISIQKSADRKEISYVGQIVNYSFLVTNTGNVQLDQVSVDDFEFNGLGTLSPITCPITTLAPGSSVTCTASYSVVDADLTRSDPGLVNIATAHGTPPGASAPVNAEPSGVRISVNLPTFPGATVSTGGSLQSGMPAWTWVALGGLGIMVLCGAAVLYLRKRGISESR